MLHRVEGIGADWFVALDVEGGNQMLYLPLDKIMQGRDSAAPGGGVRPSQSTVDQLTDAVLRELEARSNNGSSRRPR